MHQNSQSGARIPGPPLFRITMIQIACLLLAMMLIYLVHPKIVLDFGLGGTIAVVPQSYFAWLTFRYRGAREISQVLQSAFWGLTGKFFLAGALFALVFTLKDQLSAWALFAGYGALVFVQVVVSAWHIR